MRIFSGAVQVFMPLLFSPVEEMQEQALIVIGCIAGIKYQYIPRTIFRCWKRFSCSI